MHDFRLIFDFEAGHDRASTASRKRLVFTEPTDVLIAHTIDQVPGLLERVDTETRAGAWAAGYIGYEAAPAFDPAMAVRGPARTPLAWFALCREPLRTVTPVPTASHLAIDWRPDLSRSAYGPAIAEIRAAIERGETYQVNYTFRLRARSPARPDQLYDSVRAAQGPGYHALLELGPLTIASASPELFFRRSGRRITLRPMKGTVPRGRYRVEDERHAARLAASDKDRAENLMIVDLVRNDVGRLAAPGTVRVPRLFDIERFGTVFQMTSTVTADVHASTSLFEVLRAIFPCGSVTGAPKIRTMHWIAQLERSTREVYCGAIGYVQPGGDCVFSVPIRTAWLDHERGTAEYGVGGGVTWDSTSGGEYDEAIAKAAVLNESWPRFDLLETMRAEHGSCPRLERHLDRLADSAVYFGFPFDRRAAAAFVQRAVEPVDAPTRVRLLVSSAGEARVEVTGERIDPGPPPDTPGQIEPRTVMLASEPVDTSDRFLYHKTTHRLVYDRRRAEHPSAFDVLLLNQHGTVTEFTRGNIVIELGSALLTPPRSAGLLAGTLRAELLDSGKITERKLTPANVFAASRVWLISSLRGWVPVRPCP